MRRYSGGYSANLMRFLYKPLLYLCLVSSKAKPRSNIPVNLTKTDPLHAAKPDKWTLTACCCECLYLVRTYPILGSIRNKKGGIWYLFHRLGGAISIDHLNFHASLLEHFSRNCHVLFPAFKKVRGQFGLVDEHLGDTSLNDCACTI